MTYTADVLVCGKLVNIGDFPTQKDVDEVVAFFRKIENIELPEEKMRDIDSFCDKNGIK